MRSIVLRTVEQSGKVKGANFDPATGLFRAAATSIAAREIAEEASFQSSEGSRPVQDTYSIANVRLLSASQHLDVFGKLIVDDFVFPPATVARGVLEPSASAWWLLEPGIGPRSRVLRGWGDRWRMQEEIRKIPAEPMKEHAKRRLEAIASGAEQLGLTVRRDPSGAPLRIGELETPPAATVTIRQLFAQIKLVGTPIADLEGLEYLGEYFYRWLSATAHGQLHGLMEEMKPKQLSPGDPGIRLTAAESSERAVGLRTIAAVFAYQEGFSRLASLHGWSRTDWDAWVTESRRALVKLQAVLNE
ncbi:MAG TPA: hypothetical protein VMK12_25505 [Anaeromyxobacteraceae bacterium]|nr:hypothetical protein [Anaeromyxobacteraceae bacterium]